LREDGTPQCPFCGGTHVIWYHKSTLTRQCKNSKCGRNYVSTQADLDGTKPENVEEEVPKDPVRELFAKDEQKIEKKREQVSHRREAEINLMQAAVKGAAPHLSAPPQMPELLIKPGLTPTLLALNLTDHHFNRTIISETVGGLGQWDADIYGRSLYSIAYRLIRVARAQYNTENRILGLVLNALGDMGNDPHRDENKRMNQMSENMAALQQGLILAQFTDLLARQKTNNGAPLFPKILIHCVPGNEPRMDPKLNWIQPERNWDTVMYWFWSACMPYHIDRVRFEIPMNWSAYATHLGHRFLLTHGHQVKGWAGFPLYGFWKFVGRQQALRRNEGGIDIVFCGHHHQSAELDTLGAEVHVGSPLVVPDGFTVNALALAGKTGQTMFAITEKDAIMGKHNLRPRDDGEAPFVYSDMDLIRQGAQKAMKAWQQGVEIEDLD